MISTEKPAGSASLNRVSKPSRAKYSSKACVLCRRRKLKCSGNDPCDRCVHHNVSCIFSDDNNIQIPNLRRGSPAITQLGTKYDKGTSPSAMEDRLKTMEATIQALMQRVPEARDLDQDECQSEYRNGYQGETAFQSPLETFNAKIASLQAHSSSNVMGDQPMNGTVPTSSMSSRPATSTTHAIRFGARDFHFPAPGEYERYLDFFFRDINTCHPCLNEAEFSSKTRLLISPGSADPFDAPLLATNFILFALTDILTDMTPVGDERSLPGWKWYHSADEIMGKRKISGRGDLRLVQFLIYEALYLTHADKPNAAYSISGLACRLCFQLGLHQQSLWESSCTPFSRHMRQRVFWTVYYLDRRISLSCGRPYGIRDCDTDVEQPKWIDDQAIFPDQELPAPDPELSSNVYLSCMIVFAKFAGEIWDQAFSVSSKNDPLSGERTAILDARLKYWLDTGLSAMPLLPQRNQPTKRHLWQNSLVHTRINHLRLLLRRRTMVSLAYTASDGKICGQLAIEIIQNLQTHEAEAQQPSSFRFHIAVSLGGAILILATLLCRDLSSIGLHNYKPSYTESYRVGIAMLRDVAKSLHAAVRILDDLRHMVDVVDRCLEDELQVLPTNQALVDDTALNIDELFPNGLASPNFGLMTGISPASFSLDRMGALEHDGDGTQNQIFAEWDSLVDHLPAMQGGHGIPWV